MPYISTKQYNLIKRKINERAILLRLCKKLSKVIGMNLYMPELSHEIKRVLDKIGGNK